MFDLIIVEKNEWVETLILLVFLKFLYFLFLYSNKIANF